MESFGYANELTAAMLGGWMFFKFLLPGLDISQRCF